METNKLSAKLQW